MPGLRNDGIDARLVRVHLVVDGIVGALNQAKKEGLAWIPLRKTFAELEWKIGLTYKQFIAYALNGVTRGIFVLDEKNDQIRFAEKS